MRNSWSRDMAEISVTQLLFLINQQIDIHEALDERFSKAEALLKVLLEGKFLNYTTVIIYYYLWTVSDIIEQGKMINAQALNALLNYRETPIFKN